MNRQTICIIAVISVSAAVTICLRAFPFILFSSGKKCPKIIDYIGKMLSPAAIAMLAVYCLLSVYRDKTFSSGGFAIPEITASIIVVTLHWWKKNPLFSIICGTVVYMLLVQKFFCS